ncbi:MAG: molybdopterin dinucleotide binding domain-containing protein [Nitrososphaerota archaeon]|nr:molybdopterin dinucleotide-binding protein [Candidatus Bathyarchaeota archaeon]MDW8022734.1 molybdopterin dinucleotide binding domain-containing protein [Nitrososphaerota archaeon]
MGTLKVTLVTGRTISQGITREGKKKLREYMESVAVCELDPEDLGKLGVKEGEPIRVKTNYGTVIVSVKVSTQAPHPGIAFIPMGPWANEVIGQDTDSIGMPSFKGVEAEIEAAPGEKIPEVLTLIKGRM